MTTIPVSNEGTVPVPLAERPSKSRFGLALAVAALVLSALLWIAHNVTALAVAIFELDEITTVFGILGIIVSIVGLVAVALSTTALFICRRAGRGAGMSGVALGLSTAYIAWVMTSAIRAVVWSGRYETSFFDQFGYL